MTEPITEKSIQEAFGPYLGKTSSHINALLGTEEHTSSKSVHANLTKAIIQRHPDLDAILTARNITVRTVRAFPSGKPKEAISFPHFDYSTLVQESWESSSLRTRFLIEFLFVLYVIEDAQTYILKDAFLWKMPETDLDTDVRNIWKETIKRIREGRADDLPRMGEFKTCHVRPHAANGEDKILAPDGKYYVKKSFWLNQGYLQEIFSKRLLSAKGKFTIIPSANRSGTF